MSYNPSSSISGEVRMFAGSSAPLGWLLCYGQAVSRTVYSELFLALSTTYGVGDGSTTFNLPDLRGRVIAGKDDMGGVAAARLTSTTITSGGPTTLGGNGGTETHQLTTAQLAVHSHTNTLTDPSHNHADGFAGANATASFGVTTVGVAGNVNTQLGTATTNHAITSTSSTGISITNANAGSGTAHNNTQPSIILNYIIKV